ncbi:MAG: hypothetical protein WA688_04075 [Thermoplasmata archaeon]
MKPRTRWLLLAAVLVAASTLVPAAAGQLSGAAVSKSSHLTVDSDYANLNAPPTGQIVFGSALPDAEILPTSNVSLGASLGLDHLLEIAPNASDPEHPSVVAEAAPETLSRFNGTPFLGKPSYLDLVAALPVYPANSPLWTNGTTVLPTTDVSKPAILEVNYSVASGSDGSPGVLISWTVSGWPWVNPSSDELALEYVVQVASDSGFETCSGAPSTDAPDATCSTEHLAPGEAVWSSSLTALKGNGPAGSVAWISWSSQVGGSDAEHASVSAGAYFEHPGTGALVIAAAAEGASSVTGSTLFLLSRGTVSSLIAPLVGDLPVYGGAVAIFAAAAGIGVFLSRRRDRSIARELAE